MSKLAIYHGGCTDGVASAWAAWKAMPDITLAPGVYQAEPDWDAIEAAREVYFLDFSYKRPVMEQVIARANGPVTVLDHHATAEDDLTPLLADGSLRGVFDMDRCGALIAWDWFHGGKERPELLTHVDARDRWVQPPPAYNDHVIMALRSYPHETTATALERWDALMDGGVKPLIAEGGAILRYYRGRVADAISLAAQWTIGDVSMPAANTNFSFASDVAGKLANPVAACWWLTGAGNVTWSLRARGDFHAGDFCIQFGGGGHPGAAGFSIAAKLVDFDSRTIEKP